MKLHKARLRGWLPFPDEVEINFDALTEGVIAVCGENGAGKSTLVELLFPGSLYGTLPTRGSLADAAIARDAFVETWWTLPNGQQVSVRQEVDCKTRRRATVVLDANAAPLTSRAQGSEYATWASSHLPPEDFYLATAFMAQRSTGFLGLSMPVRKALVLRALGLARYEAWAQRAKERRDAASNAAVLAAEALKRARGQTPSAQHAAAGLALAQNELKNARTDLQRATDALAAAEDQAKEATALAADHERAARLRREANAAQSHAEDVLAAADREIDALEARLTELGDVEAAAERIPGHRDLLDVMRSEEERKGAARADAATALQNLQTQHRENAAAVHALQRESGHLQTQCLHIENQRLLASKVDEFRKLAEEADAAVEAMEQEVEAKRRLVLNSAHDRIDGLRGVLQVVADGGRTGEDDAATLSVLADDGLAKDDAAAAAAAAAGPAEARVRAQIPQAITDARNAHFALEGAIAGAAGLPAAEKAAAGLAEIMVKIAELVAAGPRLAEEIRAAKAAFDAADVALTSARRLRERQDRTLRDEEERAARAPEAAAVRARLEDRRGRRPALQNALQAATAALDAIPAPGKPPVLPALDLPRERVNNCADRVTAAERSAAIAERALQEAKDADAREEGAARERADAEATLADWEALFHALGRDGVQACEIDAAGPDLSTLGTDMLTACYGPRWSIALTTTRPLKDGSGDREVFDMLVTDAEARVVSEAAVERKSGGESVIVGEAFALALSTFAASREGGAAGATWVRDESGSALDPQKAVAHVQMLRRALRLAGAGRALLVTHSTHAAANCDGVLRVAGGRVTVG